MAKESWPRSSFTPGEPFSSSSMRLSAKRAGGKSLAASPRSSMGRPEAGMLSPRPCTLQHVYPGRSKRRDRCCTIFSAVATTERFAKSARNRSASGGSFDLRTRDRLGSSDGAAKLQAEGRSFDEPVRNGRGDGRGAGGQKKVEKEPALAGERQVMVVEPADHRLVPEEDAVRNDAGGKEWPGLQDSYKG